MKRIAFYIVISTFFCCSLFSQSSSKTLKIGTNSQIPPFFSISESGIPQGYIPDFFEILMDSLDMDYKFVAEPQNTLSLNDSMRILLGKNDLLTSAYSFRNERKFVFQSTPYYQLEYAIVTKDDDKEGSPRDYINKNVVVIENSSADFRIQKLSKKQFKGNLQKVSTVEAALDSVSQGCADYFFISANLGATLKREFEQRNLLMRPSNISPSDISIISTNKELIQKINVVIDELYANGTIKRLSAKWLVFYPKPERTRTLVIVATLFLIIITLVIIVSIHRRMVRVAVEKKNVAFRRNKELMASINLLLHDGQLDIYMFDVASEKLRFFVNGQFEDRNLSASLLREMHPDDIGLYEELRKGLLNKTITRKTLVLRLRKPNEKYVYFEYVVNSIMEDGLVCNYIFTRRNITEHKEELRVRKESIANLQLAMQLTETARWEYDRGTELAYFVNKNGAKRTVAVSSLFNRLSKEELQKLNDYLDEIQNTRVSKMITLRVHSPLSSDRIHLYQLNARVKFDTRVNHEILIGVITDVTEYHKNRRRIEDLQRNITLALEAGGLTTWTYNHKKEEFSILSGDAENPQILSKQEHDEMTHPHDREILSKAMEDVLSGQQQRLEIKIRINLNGYKYLWMSYYLMPVYEEDGSINTITGTRQDITQDVYREIELKKEQDSLQSIIDNLPVPIYIKDAMTQKIVYRNESVVRTYLLGRDTDTFEKALGAESYQKSLEVDRKVLLLREEYKAHEDIILANGELRNTFVQKSIINYNHSDHILVVRYDYTEQRSIESAQKMLSVSLPAINGFTWKLDGRDRSLTYYSSSEVLKGRLESLSTVEKLQATLHQDDRERFIKKINMLLGGELGQFYMSYRAIIAGEDEPQWWDVRGVAEKIEVDNEEFVVLNGISLNVTHQKQNELELLKVNEQNKIMIKDLGEAKEKAEESERLKMAFLANMSHEIRTPLNAIVGFSELLFDTYDDEEKNEYIGLIKRNNEILLRLIGDILDLSKIESGSIEMNPTEMDFSQFFESIYATWLLQSIEKGVELIKENPYDYCMVVLDNKFISQIATNFISNAFKYCPSGSITMGYEYVDDGIKFYVKDTGIGIEKDKLALTFGRFAKLDDFAQGTGLGLSICKALAETAGGTVGVESEFGVGSTFWVWLPTKVEGVHKKDLSVAQTSSSDVPIVSSDEKVKLREDHGEIKKILVAEDNDSNYILIRALLQKDFQLTHAQNGAEALELVRKNHYDAILMDMRMPVMDGLEATRRIREFNKETLIITLTGNAFDYDREAALEAGSDIFMTKPIKRQELFDNLQKNKKG